MQIDFTCPVCSSHVQLELWITAGGDLGGVQAWCRGSRHSKVVEMVFDESSKWAAEK